VYLFYTGTSGYISTNSGASWSALTLPYGLNLPVCNSTGQHVFSPGYNIQVYSHDYGNTWTWYATSNYDAETGIVTPGMSDDASIVAGLANQDTIMKIFASFDPNFSNMFLHVGNLGRQIPAMASLYQVMVRSTWSGLKMAT
jgi:hypothetical protein